MSVYYTTRKSEARRMANAIYNVLGTPASVLREGTAWRVQHNDLSGAALDVIERMLDSGERYTAITRHRIQDALEMWVNDQDTWVERN